MRFSRNHIKCFLKTNEIQNWESANAFMTSFNSFPLLFTSVFICPTQSVSYTRFPLDNTDTDRDESPPTKKIKEEVVEEENEEEEDEEEEGLIPSPPTQSEKQLAEPSNSVPAKTKEQLEEEEREKMLVLVSNFTEDQLDRYEMFRRAAFPKATVKRVMQNITGCSIIEEALDALERSCGETDPGLLKPKDLREAA
ncbi:TAF11 [Lepeophtheirus salmonis]|uniref:TAF11 n=1 Tax=Lepeophtheirus salmonis TaxID=72036 RepID=A0A7R8HBR2_LEPSM|nr:TAF11 [Lepeophtheirus salmonis]CAF2986186.1 TAF11 [Lepeophtheirus salmonis]